MKWSKQQCPMDCEAIAVLLNDMTMLQSTILKRFNSQEFEQYATLVFRDEMKRFRKIYGETYLSEFGQAVCLVLHRLACAIGLDGDTCESVKRMHVCWYLYW